MQIAVNVCRDQMRTSWFRLADSKGALDALNRAAVEASEEAVLLRIMIGFSAEKVQRSDLDVLLSGYGGMRNRHCARRIDSCCVPKAEGGRANAQSIQCSRSRSTVKRCNILVQSEKQRRRARHFDAEP